LSLAVPACSGFAFVSDAPIGEARCAADITGVMAGVFASLAPALTLKKNCGHAHKHSGGNPAEYLPELPDRRLSSDEFADFDDFANHFNATFEEDFRDLQVDTNAGKLRKMLFDVIAKADSIANEPDPGVADSEDEGEPF